MKRSSWEGGKMITWADLSNLAVTSFIKTVWKEESDAEVLKKVQTYGSWWDGAVGMHWATFLKMNINMKVLPESTLGNDHQEVWNQPTLQEFVWHQGRRGSQHCQWWSFICEITYTVQHTWLCGIQPSLIFIEFLNVVIFTSLGSKLFLRGMVGKTKPSVYYMKKSNYGKEEWASSSTLFCDLNNKHTYKLKINTSFGNRAFLSCRLHWGLVLEHCC